MNLTYEECQLLAQWLNTLKLDPDAIPDDVAEVLARLDKVVSSPKC